MRTQFVERDWNGWLMRPVRPLRGKVFLEMVPPDQLSDGGIYIPEFARQDPMTDLGRAKLVRPRGEPVRGYVRAIGPWRVVKKGKCKGFQVMPEFKINDLVIIPAGAGQRLTDGFGHGFKMVDQADVLAVIPQIAVDGKPALCDLPLVER